MIDKTIHHRIHVISADSCQVVSVILCLVPTMLANKVKVKLIWKLLQGKLELACFAIPCNLKLCFLNVGCASTQFLLILELCCMPSCTLARTKSLLAILLDHEFSAAMFTMPSYIFNEFPKIRLSIGFCANSITMFHTPSFYGCRCLSSGFFGEYVRIATSPRTIILLLQRKLFLSFQHLKFFSTLRTNYLVWR